MKSPLPLVFAGVICLCTSCGKDREAHAVPEPEAVRHPSASPWDESDFTPWMSRAELQHYQNTSPSDQYFAHVEGRNNSGRLEYRAAVMPFNGDPYEQWAVFWGIDEEELFKCEMNLLANGFIRQDAQVFADQTGKSLHQIVWLKPKTSVEVHEPKLVGQERSSGAGMAPAPSPGASPMAPLSPTTATGVPPVRETGMQEANAVAPAHETQVPGNASEAPQHEKPEISKDPVHIVRQGDTLGKIAKKSKISVAELKAFNHLKSDVLRIGQKLRLSAPEE